MKPEDFHLFEPLRVLLGDVPWSFLLEILLRVLFLYGLLVLSMRLMGKRMGGQLSRNEMAALVSLAAAIGVPIQAPDRGLVAPVVIAAIIVVGQRLISRATLRSKRFEELSQDDIAIMVENGCLHLEKLEEAVLPQEGLFAQLRSKGITHLGQVKRLYMEANGNFTLLPQTPPQPGLSLIPDWDEEFRQEQPLAPETFACNRCGQLHQSQQAPSSECPRCGNTRWVPAITSPPEPET